MQKIKEDISNNLYILRFVKEAGKICFLIIAIDIFVETVAYYIGTNIGLWIFDSVEKEPPLKACILVVCIFVTEFILYLIQDFLNMYNKVIANNKITEYITHKLIVKNFEIRQKEIDKPAFYDKYSRAISEVSTRPGEVLNLTKNIIGGVIQLLMVSLVVSQLDLFITYVYLAASILYTIVVMCTNKYEYEKYTESTIVNRKLSYVNRLIYEKEYGLLLRNNLGYKDVLIRHYSDNIKDLCNITKRYNGKLFSFKVMQLLISVICFCIVPWTYSIIGLANGDFTFGEVTLLMGASNFIPQLCTKLFGSIVSVRKQSMYIGNLRDILEYDRHSKKGVSAVPTLENNLLYEVRNISFSYHSEENKIILNHISFNIRKGEKIMLVGPNGAGKSTLINLLSGIYSPVEGKILLNGCDLEDCDLPTLHKNVIVINQSAIMLSFSIAENILQRPVESLNDYKMVEMALKKVGMYDKVINLKNGMDTSFSREFDEDGVTFSGGEIQKLAIARILVSDAEMVIMDEPTSALDAISESEIIELVLRLLKDRTVLIISHRLFFARNVDTVCYIDGGEIKELGSHEELMSKKGRYFDLFAAQQNKYLDGAYV